MVGVDAASLPGDQSSTPDRMVLVNHYQAWYERRMMMADRKDHGAAGPVTDRALRALLQQIGVIASIYLISASIVRAADDACANILKFGIYDYESVLDDRESFELAKNTYCSTRTSSNASDLNLSVEKVFSFGGSQANQLSQQFCSSSYDEIWSDSRFRRVVSTVNSAIVSAWTTCISRRSGDVIHYLQPTVDPNRFIYRLRYDAPAGGPYEVAVDHWEMTGERCCLGTTPSEGDAITEGGFEIQCIREPDSAVVVTAGAHPGGQNLANVQLQRASLTNRERFTQSVSAEDCELIQESTGAGRFSARLSGVSVLGLHVDEESIGNAYVVCTIMPPDESSNLTIEYGPIDLDWGQSIGSGGGAWLAILPDGADVQSVREHEIANKASGERRERVEAGQLLVTGEHGRPIRVAFAVRDAWSAVGVSATLQWLSLEGERPSNVPTPTPGNPCEVAVSSRTPTPTPIAPCPGDLDLGGSVSISELIAAVNSALEGCPN